MFSDEQKFRVYNPSSVWGKLLYFPHTDEGLYTWNVCLFFFKAFATFWYFL